MEWADVVEGLEALRVLTVRTNGPACQLRTAPRGVAGQVLGAVGVALGPGLKFLDNR